MLKVWPAAVARVKEEVAAMRPIAAKDGVAGPFEPWDYLYFAEKVRKARYDLDQAELKPYFELDNMLAAAMWVAEQNYGLTFTEITGRVPVFHPDVRVWEAKYARSGVSRGLYYLDNFARAGKRSGSWTSRFRPQSTFDGAVTTLTSNNSFSIRLSSPEAQPVLEPRLVVW